MRPKSPFAAFCLGLMLSGSFALPRGVFAQESAAEGAKRKVRTRVTPDFPPLAKEMHMNGKVKIEATVSPEGRVTSTKVVGGSPVLVPAAVDAAKQWRFESGPKETTEVLEFDFTSKK